MAKGEHLKESPRRRVVTIAKIEGDTWADVGARLHSLADEIARKGRLPANSVSGGYNDGHIVVSDENGDITHDSWAAELSAWLDARAALSAQEDSRG